MSTSEGGMQAMLIMPTSFDPPTSLVGEWVSVALTGVPASVRLRAALVSAELVDNARRYGRAPYVVHLTLDRSHRVLFVAVEDDMTELRAGWSETAEMVLVRGLAQYWGVEHYKLGKAVWAELSLEPADIDAPDRAPPTVHGEP
jgi:hypothetical protein